MLIQAQRWGNSLAVRIPRAFAAEVGIEEGTEVDISLDEGAIRLRPVSGPKCRLEDLLEQITPDNLHAEIESGPSIGQETW